jgi:hypothetical protein
MLTLAVKRSVNQKGEINAIFECMGGLYMISQTKPVSGKVSGESKSYLNDKPTNIVIVPEQKLSSRSFKLR